MGTVATAIGAPKGIRRVEIVFILGALTAFAPLSIDMYLPSLPTLERYFHASAGDVQFTMSTFFVGFSAGQSLYGPLADRFGRKPPLLIGMLLYVLASVACALAPSAQMMAAFRLVQAIGACSGAVIARAMVRDLFPPEETRKVYSSLLLVMGVAPLVAPLVGAYLLVWLGWQAAFWLLAGGGVLAVAGAWLRLPESHADRHPLSFSHVFSTYKGLLRDKVFLGATLATGFSSAGMFAYITGAPFVFMNIYGVRPERFGWLIALNALAVVGSAQVNGRVFHGHHPAKLMRNAAFVQCAAGVLLVGAALVRAPQLWGVGAPLWMYLASVGFVFPNAVALAMAHHGRNAGMASALLGTIQFSMAAVATIVMGTVNSSTAMPMAAIIGACGTMAVGTHLWLLGRRAESSR
ncbi:MAG TPA: Bcr/CflA family multidrug efflux MFS transporter [Bryobacteraceae bacterium]|jgi:DHA1 family bicyclomycin/chloramphenicol resistance-like MFS transporter